MTRLRLVLAAIILTMAALVPAAKPAGAYAPLQIPLRFGVCSVVFHFKTSLPQASQVLVMSETNKCKVVGVQSIAGSGYLGPYSYKVWPVQYGTVTSWLPWTKRLCYGWVVLVDVYGNHHDFAIVYPTMKVL